MNKLILLFVFTCFARIVDAQTIATTTTGKKVILYSDKTWKYASGNEDEKTCERKKIGYIIVTNNTASEIYFHYQSGNFGDIQTRRINTSDSISLEIYTGNTITTMRWVVTSEPIVITTSKIDNIKSLGFENDKQQLEICESKSIIISK